MKFTPSHFETLRQAIAPFNTPEIRARYLAGDFPRADKVKDLNKRYRWDLFYAAGGVNIIPDAFNAYSDAHIDTALKAIIAPLNNATR